jgi:hypothetical protein
MHLPVIGVTALRLRLGAKGSPDPPAHEAEVMAIAIGVAVELAATIPVSLLIVDASEVLQA